ncbi:MAG TPA: endonuclease III [Gemmatimonadales bacterium]|nr:endonuclease III [Gemmatimonadales bacterium]
MRKRRFRIGPALASVRRAVRPLPKAAMFALAEEGHRSLFEQLVACILSIRTRDEVSLQAARRLFAAAGDPQRIAALDVAGLDELIGDTTFHGAKAPQIREIARRTVEDHGGTLPCDADLLRGFRGVGPKCAHLALGVACGERLISVDIHVHRVTNRWGYVGAPSPERTMAALAAVLPRRYWVEINALLVPFGKHVCTGRLPKCSTCPVLDMCRQVGVTTHR